METKTIPPQEQYEELVRLSEPLREYLVKYHNGGCSSAVVINLYRAEVHEFQMCTIFEKPPDSIMNRMEQGKNAGNNT